MLRDDRELLADLKRACNQSGNFAIAFIEATLPIAAEEEYGLLLADVARRILIHAKMRKRYVIDCQPEALDGPYDTVSVKAERPELPSAG